MYELEQVGRATYVIRSPANMGVYVTGSDAVLLDSGNDRDAAKKVLRLFEERRWTLRAVFNTHANADHIGGNRLLQERTGCPIYAQGTEAHLASYPLLEPAILYGGYPPAPLRNKFLMAQESDVRPLSAQVLPEGLTALPLPGHFFDMVGFRTADDVVFLADALVDTAILNKYHISFLLNIGAAISTLEAVCSMRAELFVPAHAAPTRDIAPLARANLDKIREISALLLRLCAQPCSPEQLLERVCGHYSLQLDWNQYVLVGSCLRSYVSHLLDSGALTACFDRGRLLLQAV